MSYIYVRANEWLESHNEVKVGGCENIPNRESGYVTGERKRGKFVLVIELYDDWRKIETLIKKNFKNLHRYIDGCTEIYSDQILSEIIPFLLHSNIKFKILTDDEINKLLGKKYSSQIPQETQIVPSYEQQEVLNKIIQFYSENKIGKIIWPCGLGKTILSLLIANRLNAKRICICVPWRNLLFQFKEAALNFFNEREIYIDNVPSSKKEKFLVISTYYFSSKLKDIKFDLKIGDEAHHLVGNVPDGGSRAYNHFHEINSDKTLFMTATEKIADSDYSMDSEDIFGKVIDQKSFHWAIENKKISDYCVLCLKSSMKEIDLIIEKHVKNHIVINKKLFLAAYMCIKSMVTNKKLTHILCYTNTTADSDLLKKYISYFINEPYFYNESLHSKSTLCLEDEINKFKNSSLGIICSVAQFGEGIDLPCLNGICATEDIGSKIKGTQYLTRHLRLDKKHPNKIGFTLIPIVEESENALFSLISQLRNIDAGVEQKIKIFTNKINSEYSQSENDSLIDLEFEESENELEKIKFKARLSKNGFSEEENEYVYEKICIKGLYSSKEEYSIQTGNEDRDLYYKRKGIWKNWYDFLGFDTEKFIKTKQEWINFCKVINIKSSTEYILACGKYPELPKEPGYFYKDFTNLSNELGIFKMRR